ncbi:unnamed protein product [Lepeophtheirus salmonis]|uniref:(salmon louse) hypothetical protein n=1 Tax=Lepeophtheirus salmonis TaxID=72036 RepID=A0A7R8CEY2_LEPSM|nr:unnamed protein product [Lepeophtheirus salmonis]CAF2799743.1 unnamed protein product [Lepeophtheirus salmonis]
MPHVLLWKDFLACPKYGGANSGESNVRIRCANRESNRRASQKELGISDSSDDDVEISDDEEDLREMMELIEDDEQNNQEYVGALTPGNSKGKPNSVPKKSQPKSKQRNRRETPLWKFVSTGEDTARVMPEWLDQTSLYALQENPNKPLKLNVNELEQFIGTLLAMYIVKLSNSRLYWSNNLQCVMVTEAFSRDRWEQIKSNLHCNDNSQAPKYGDPNYDKLYKIRPLINHLQSKFRKIPMPQMLCVDEQFVPFKGKSSLKHYIPSKPHKWGYKIMALCGSDGVLYDFHVCDSPLKPVEGEPDLGASSNIVLQLAQTIPVGLNHLLYHDNWFTSLPLVTNLAKKQIYCLGTVRQVRLPGVPFHTDKELMKKGRGTHEEVSTLVDCVEVRAVKWLDNKCVNLLSTFSSALPLEECKRFDKKKKEITMIVLQ